MNQAGAIFAGISAAMSVAGVAATYTRGDTAIDLTALPGAKAPQRALDGVGSVQMCDASYILQTASLGEFELPREGDRFTVDQGGRLQVFELQELTSGAQAWSYLPGNEFVRLLLTLVSDADGDAVDHDSTPGAPSENTGTGLKWRREVTVTNTTSLTLSGVTLQTGDVLELVIDHDDNQRTLTFFSGIDFAFTAPSTIALTNLPVAIGDDLIITNFGKSRV